jgi:hypothetical protein
MRSWFNTLQCGQVVGAQVQRTQSGKRGLQKAKLYGVVSDANTNREYGGQTTLLVPKWLEFLSAEARLCLKRQSQNLYGKKEGEVDFGWGENTGGQVLHAVP